MMNDADVYDEIAQVRRMIRSARSPEKWPERELDGPGQRGGRETCADTRRWYDDGPPLPAAFFRDASNIRRVDDADSLTVEQFQEQFERASEPALLAGLMTTWPAFAGGSRSSQQKVHDSETSGSEEVDIGDGSDQAGTRVWTPQFLVDRFGEEKFECGLDSQGNNAYISLRTYAQHFVPHCRDRNPFIIFDSTIIGVQRLRALGQQRAVNAQASSKSQPVPVGAACSTPLVFLDVDGVLNRTSSATHVRVDADLVARLDNLLRRTGARIVFSTFWREFHPYLEYILRRHGVDASVAGRTAGAPTVTRHKNQVGRGEEIEQYLRSITTLKGQGPPYVIIDDRATAAVTAEQRSRFVHTSTANGLTDADVDKAVSMIKEQQKQRTDLMPNPHVESRPSEHAPLRSDPQGATKLGGTTASVSQCKLDHLSRDFSVPAVFATDDFLQHLGDDRPPFQWFIYGVAGSGSPCHTDPIGTAAWNALLHGRKRWVMFHPSTPRALLQTPSLDAGVGDDEAWEDLWGWFQDLAAICERVQRHFATLESLGECGYEPVEGASGPPHRPSQWWWFRDFVQEEGQIVFVPANWHHAVLNVTTHTIAVTQNYCSRNNVAECLASMEDDALAERLRREIRQRYPQSIDWW